MGGLYDNMTWRTLAASVTYGASCVYCGSRDNLHAHHKTPRLYGGRDVRENLEPVCASCHPRAEKRAALRCRARGLRPVFPRPRPSVPRRPMPRGAMFNALTRARPPR